MEPLFAKGAWALSLVGIAALVCAARKAERFMTWATMITERFINGNRANSEGALW